MDLKEDDIDRWLDRGSRFFQAAARNPVVREALRARGLTDEELATGWQLYSALNGFGGEGVARAATHETAASQALHDIDAWDAPAYNAAKAVLEARFPAVAVYLFDNLQAAEGIAAVAGVERFLDRIAALRDGKAPNVAADAGKAAVDLLAVRKILDAARETQLRTLIDIVRRGARPDEVVLAPEVDPRRVSVAEQYVTWINEWREVARVSIARRDYRIQLGLAQRRQAANGTVKPAKEEEEAPN